MIEVKITSIYQSNNDGLAVISYTVLSTFYFKFLKYRIRENDSCHNRHITDVIVFTSHRSNADDCVFELKLCFDVATVESLMSMTLLIFKYKFFEK